MKTRADIAAVRSFVSLFTFLAFGMPSHCLRFGYDRAHLRRLQSIVSVLTTLCVCTLFSAEVLTLQWASMKCDVRIEAECVCRFCFDVPGIFLGWLRGSKDRTPFP